MTTQKRSSSDQLTVSGVKVSQRDTAMIVWKSGGTSKDSAPGQASDTQSNYISIQSPSGPTTVAVNSSSLQG